MEAFVTPLSPVPGGSFSGITIVRDLEAVSTVDARRGILPGPVVPIARVTATFSTSKNLNINFRHSHKKM